MSTEFFKPLELADATKRMGQYGARAAIVNGGTDIVIEIAHRRISPAAIVYVQGIKELQGIRRDGEYLVLGGAVTYLQMQDSPICQRVTGLMAALSRLGSPPVRAVATPAGNIGTAAPSADCTTMLMALEAEVVLASTGGERGVPLEKFFLGRGKTELHPDEIIKEIRFPAPETNFGTGYARVARRKAQDIGKALCGVSLHLENNICSHAAVSLGALNATCVRATSIEKAIVGLNRADSVSYAQEHFPLEAGLRESYFKHYKELVTTSVVARALDMAWESAERAKGE